MRLPWWETGKRNTKLTKQLAIWADEDRTGIAFDSSTGFTLPNGADRSPDAAWVRQERIDVLNPDPNKFLPLALDFAVQLMSANDRLEKARAKMVEYRDNGVRLGWLIDPQNKCVEIYRLCQDKEMLQSPTTLSGEDVLQGLCWIWARFLCLDFIILSTALKNCDRPTDILCYRRI